MKKEILIHSENELIKHSSTIHISNSLSITERKLYNILLKNAYSNLLSKRLHSVDIKDLMKLIGRSGNNYQNLKLCIKNLMETSVEWNILGKDNKNKWGITTFLSGAKIEDGVCTYEYSSFLIQFLANPNIYARLNLLIQKKFTNKYALILWEFLNDQLCTNQRNNISTEYFSVDNVKRIFGTTSSYSEFKVFNRSILQKAIKEVNDLSDIQVEISLKKELRKIIAISFSVKKKDNIEQNNMSIQTTIQSELDNLNLIQTKIINQDKVPDRQDLKKILNREFKISKARAIKLIAEHTTENIEKSLEYVREQIRNNQKIINIAAYTVKAIKEGWMQTESSSISQNKTREEQIAEAEEYLEQLEDKIKCEIWWKVWMDLRSQTEIFEFRNWLSHLKYESEEGDTNTGAKTVKLYVLDNSFIQRELQAKYEHKILKVWQSYDSQVSKIEIGLKKQ